MARRITLIAAAALVAVLTMGAKGCGTTKDATSQTVAPSTAAPAAAPPADTSAATPAPTVPPTEPPTTVAPGITLKVSGTSPTANDITVLDGGNESQHNGVTLPYSTTLADHPFDVGITAQAGSDQTNATITCEIDLPGKPPVTNTSTGAYSVVNCTATPGL